MPYSLRKKSERKSTKRLPEVNKSLYLPYVDDQETPADIMKKFEILEEIMKEKENAASNDKDDDDSSYGEDGALDADSLRELYSKIGTVIDQPEEEEERFDDDDFLFADDMDDDDDYEYYDIDENHDPNRPYFQYVGAFRYNLSRTRHMIDAMTSQASKKCYRIEETLTGKVKLVYIADTAIPYPYVYIRVPQNIPFSWSKQVKPYNPVHYSSFIRVNNVLKFDLLSLHKQFNVVYFNIPLDFNVLHLRNFNLPRSVVPKGTMVDVINIFEEKGFFYVENLVFVDLHTDDYKIDRSSLLRSSKRMLLLLRRGQKLGNGAVTFDALDLRHQRTVDSILARWSNHPESLMNQCVYTMIETLVPRSQDGGLKNSDEYLQLFGTDPPMRPHWLFIQNKCVVS